MLGSAHRMRRSTEFQAAHRGRRAARPTLVAHLAVAAPETATASEPSSAPRVGFIVSRTVGSAVTRNRLRRRLRHLVAPYVSQLPVGSLLVIRALPAAAAAPVTALQADVDAALRRLLSSAAPRTVR